MSVDRPKRSFCLLHTDRTSKDGLRDKRRSSHATNLTKSNLQLIILIYFDVIQLIGSTRHKFDVWPNRSRQAQDFVICIYFWEDEGYTIPLCRTRKMDQ